MDLTLLINKEDPRNNPVYMQIYHYLRLEIESNRLGKGTKLPSIRYLAQHLAVNKNTVDNAYRQLQAEGYITSRERSGWYVGDLEPSLIEHYKKPAVLLEEEKLSKKESNFRAVNNNLLYDFRYGKIDAKQFPDKLWQKALAESLHTDKEKALYYGEPQGELGLRKGLARYLYQSRGVRCEPDQIIIGSGTQYLLSMLTLLLKQYGQKLAIEDPGYDIARAVFKNAEYEIAPIPVEEDGINVAELRKSDSRCVFITPSHQFPLGMILPIKKRMKLLKWANEVNGLIIEDDYDGEFRFQGHPVPSLQGIDTNERVIYFGSFSKSLTPSLHTAYMVLPRHLLGMWREKFALYNSNISSVQQEALSTFIKKGHWARHLRRMRALYARKQEILLKALNSHITSKIIVKGTGTGLHIFLEVPGLSVSASSIIEKANEAGIGLHSAKPYWVKQNEKDYPAFLIGFGGIDEEDIEEGIRLLAEILNKAK